MPGSELGEKAIFNVVRTIQSPEAREEYLRQVCGDDEELRNRVSVLLHGFEAEESFLESPAAGVAAAIQTLSEQEGDSIGPYKLIEQIGEGGMGVVYMAEQKKPVRRKVALKIIKPGMDTKQVVARFEAERQALALMNHPNVAKVLDAGATDSGRPYFVMELVRGIPLTEFCDQQKYDTRRRLELFATVCQAVQHAHQKGIIHRDIKPTNVLVELHDVTAVPKVIDFGVAKATTHNLTEHSIHTGFSQMIGTPLYMSPEQAELSGLDVDTRTDIYSLGVLLYELLTGTTPFDRETLKQAGYDEMRRIIREDDPAKPSARISTLAAESLSTISERRSCDPRRLGQTVRGELDWIAMKSLEKDRTRRYETASALAADIERHLTDQPVIACPPSTTYRMTKFARRNKFALCVGGLLASVLLAGVVGLFVSNQLIAQQKEEADRQRNIADENFRQAREAVDGYLLKVSNEKLLDVPELQPLRKDLLALARDYYLSFVEKRGDDPTLQADLAATLTSLGQIENLIGTKESALEYYEKALGIHQKLLNARPDSLDAQDKVQAAYFRLGTQHFLNGQNQEASDALKESLRRMNELVEKDSANSGYVARLGQCYQVYGHTLWWKGARDASKVAYARSLEIMEDLVEKHPEEPSYKKSLAAAYLPLGNRSAESIAKAAAVMEELVEDHPKDDYRAMLAQIYSFKAGGQLSQHTERARKTIQQATEILEELVSRNASNTEYRNLLGGCLDLLSQAHVRLGNYEEAENVTSRFVDVMEHLAEKNPKIASYHEQITRHLIRLGREYRTASDLARAGDVFLEAITNCERAVAKRPQYLSLLNCAFFTEAVRELTDVFTQLDRNNELQTILRERLNKWENIRDKSGEHEIWCLSVEMKLHYIMSLWLSNNGNSVEADRHLEQAYLLSKRAVELEPEQDTMEEAMARHHWNLFAIRFFKDRNWQGADAVGRMAVELPPPNHMEAFLWLGGKKEEYREFCRSLIVGLPVEPGPRPAGFDDFRPARNDPNVVRVCTLDAMAAGDPERVLQVALRAMEEAPDDIPAFYHLALGRAYYRAGKHALAISELEKILSDPKNASPAVVYLDLAIAHQLKGDHEKAKERLDQATSLLDEIEARDFFGDEIHPHEKTEIEVLRIEAEELILGLSASVQLQRQEEVSGGNDVDPSATVPPLHTPAGEN